MIFKNLFLVGALSFGSCAFATQMVDIAYQERPSYGALWNEAAQLINVDPLLLYAVALAESGIERQPGTVSPWPFTIRALDARYYADSREEAEKALTEFLKEYSSVDVGMGQINLRWNGHLVENPNDLFDPAVNLKAMTTILSAALKSTDNTQLAIGRYHSWDEQRALAFGNKILNIYKNLKTQE